MGLFKKLKRGFKKITRGIKKAVKGVVKGVKKVVKKISSSKILKALAIAAAVIVTGGAALGAMTGAAGTAGAVAGSGFGTWMAGASAAISATPVIGTLAAPFAALGTAIGSAVTGMVGTAAVAPTSQFAGTAPQQLAVTASPSAVAGSSVGATGTAAQQLAITASPSAVAGTAASVGGSASAQLASTIPQATSALVAPTATANTAAALSGQAASTASFASKYPKTSAFLNNKYVQGAGVAAGNLAMSVAGGYAMHKLTEEDPSGNPQGAAYEGSSQFDPLQVYAGYRGIDESDVSKYFTFGNTPSAGNMPLFTQQTIGVLS